MDLKHDDSKPDEEIDFSDLPEVPPEKFAQATVRKGLKPVASLRSGTIDSADQASSHRNTGVQPGE